MKELELDPSGATWKDASEVIYQGIMDGKFSKGDYMKFMEISMDEIYDPRPVRILAKVIGILLERQENKGVIVEVDKKQWLVCIEKEQIKIKGPSRYDCPDGSRVTVHDTKSDAVTAAAILQEGYIEDELSDEDGNPEISYD